MERFSALKMLKLQWDRVSGLVCGVAAVVMLVTGWVGLSDRNDPADQIPFIMSGGLGALLLIGIGATLWLSADLRDEWHTLEGIGETLREGAGAAPVELDQPRSITLTENGVTTAEPFARRRSG